MNRRVLVWVVLAMVLCKLPACSHPGGDTPPPGAIRWDTSDPANPYPITPGPTPVVYTLGHPLAESRDIGVDDAGRLCVMDGGRRIVARFNLEGGLDTLWLDEPTRLPQKWDMMYHIATLPDDRLYLICQRQDKVFQLGPGGEVAVLPGIASAGEIAATSDGTYVLHRYDYSGSESSLNVFSPDGKLQAHWKTPCFRAITVGPDGLIYATAVSDMRIFVYDLKGSLEREINVGVLPLSNNATSWFMDNIQVDTNGDIYVTHGYLVRLDHDGKPIARWSPYRGPDTPQSFMNFRDLAVRNGVIYGLVYDLNSLAEIQAFTPDGQCIARYKRLKPALELPGDIAIQSDGSYAVTQTSVESTPMGVLMFNDEGEQIGSAEADPHVPSIAARDGRYYLAQSYSLDRVDAYGGNRVRIMRHTPDYLPRLLAINPQTDDLWAFSFAKARILGKDDKEVGTVELQAKPYPYVSGVAITQGGVIYACDQEYHRVVKCDLQGRLLDTFGSQGTGLGQLCWPAGIAVDPQGRVLVADVGNSRIHAFSSDGEPLGIWGRYGKGDGELDRPEGLAIGPNNVLFIADTHNDRIVKVPLADFWAQLTKEIKAPPPYITPEKVPMPIPGEVTVEGIVVAGTDDFTDCVYMQAADRSWGTRVTMPANVPANRGERIKVTGTLELKEHAAKHVKASKSEFVASIQSMPGPLGMANLYVGDGYRMGGKPADLSNLGLLIKSWGRVLMVDPLNSRFVISDGSRLGNASGLEVYAGQLKSPLTQWPKVGQYVMVTGISAVRPVGDGTFHPAIRLRAQEDLQVLIEN